MENESGKYIGGCEVYAKVEDTINHINSTTTPTAAPITPQLYIANNVSPSQYSL